MDTLRHSCCAALAAVGILVMAGTSAAAEGLAAAIGAGEAGIVLRYRYEFVDQETFDENANASTLRLRLNYRTAAWRAWSGFAEFDHVFEVLLDEFNSGSGTSSPQRNDYPVVADPDGPDLNQLYLQYAPDEDWRVRVGRQRILLDDERFVGGVGWRQNEQTYDGLSVAFGGVGNADVFYSYLGNVNRIIGREVAAGDHRQDTHLLNAGMRLTDAWKLTAYGYVIDNEDVPAFSTRTFGLRASGAIDVGGGNFEWLAEFARQSDNADNPASFDADYYRIQADWHPGRLSLGGGVESLGSDAGGSFRTPLATLHAFNGWADQFLSTPAAGLDDVYLKFGYKPGNWTLQLVYHDFTAESASDDYGHEFDVSASRRLGKRYGVLVKLAVFEGDAAAYPDTTKIWFMLTAGF